MPKPPLASASPPPFSPGSSLEATLPWLRSPIAPSSAWVASPPAAFGATCTFEFERNYPPTINHPAEANFAREVMADIVGADNVMPQEPTMGAEDFSYMLQAKPGAYCFIGNGDGVHREIGHGEGPCTLHNPNYDFNDALIPLGATYWVKLVEASLR